MRVAATISVAAPPERIWEHVADPGRQLHFMSGVTRWEVAGDVRQGLGARYRMLMRVGSAEVGGLVEVVEFDVPRDLAWTSITGIDQRAAGGCARTARRARAWSCGWPTAWPARASGAG